MCVASGCPINDLLRSPIHFWSLLLGRFSDKSSFSTATPDFVNYQRFPESAVNGRTSRGYLVRPVAGCRSQGTPTVSECHLRNAYPLHPRAFWLALLILPSSATFQKIDGPCNTFPGWLWLYFCRPGRSPMPRHSISDVTLATTATAKFKSALPSNTSSS